MQLPELAQALRSVARDLGAEDEIEVRLERPQAPEHGDLATNLAMLLSGRLERRPREIAAEIVRALDIENLPVGEPEIAGPGFINFRVERGYLLQRLRDVAMADARYGRTDRGAGRRVIVEFVSANPTGPLHVGHGRGAAVGDSVARLLEWTGYRIHREFYVNDAGAQIEKLVDSVHARYQRQLGVEAAVPEGGYHGDYVTELAADVRSALGATLTAEWDEAQRTRVREFVLDRMQAEQRTDLAALRVSFDEFYPESAIYESGRIDETLQEIERRDLSYRREGALWLRSTRFGDDKDRVLVKSDGTYTYFLPDIAYHWDKARRGFEVAIDIWGADHHGYVPRMSAAMEALGVGRDFFEAVIVQLVRVERGGEEVKLSKRAGEFVTLRDLIDEVGADVTRYFFLERGPQQQMVFDLDLARERSEKNPVYKVQYAHARLRSVYRKGEIDPGAIDVDVDLAPLDRPEERELIKTLLDFPDTLDLAAESRSPHRVTAYLEVLANQLNSWYHAGTRDASLRVLGVDDEVSRARLVLARAAEIVLRNGLEVLGIEAPERM